MPGPAEVTGQSLKDVLAGTKERHQPLGMASLPFRRVCTRCPSVGDAIHLQNSLHAPLPKLGTWVGRRRLEDLVLNHGAS